MGQVRCDQFKLWFTTTYYYNQNKKKNGSLRPHFTTTPLYVYSVCTTRPGNCAITTKKANLPLKQSPFTHSHSTDRPTHLPTYLPSYLPTDRPTYLPTYRPTYLPTCLPTYLPIYRPTPM